MPCENSRSQQEEERLFFPGKDPANEKLWTISYSPPKVLFTLYKRVHRLFLHSNLHEVSQGCRLQIAIFCWSWINPYSLQKYLAVHICFRSTFLWSLGDQRRPSKALGLVNKWVQDPRLNSLSLTAFFTKAGVWSSFSWIQAHALFVFEVLQALFRIYFKFSSFWLRPCCLHKYSFGALVWFWNKTISTSSGWEAISPFVWKKGIIHRNCVHLAIGPFLWHKGCSLETGWKALCLTSLGLSCFLRTGWY